LPITEDATISPISPYGIHKAVTESLLINYSIIFGLSLTIFRLFSVYGPGLKKQLIWDVFIKSLIAARNGRNELLLLGTGNETRDFIYIDDVCEAILLNIKSKTLSNIDIYNLGSGIQSSVYEIATSTVKK
jgi:nucleoside-diphosphate-sugar epimerase